MVVIQIEEYERTRTANLPYSLPKKLTIILDFYKWAVHNKKTSAVFVVDGRSGMGKTTLAGQVGLYCDSNFNLDNYHFTPQSFIQALQEAQKGSFILFDEAMLISSRNALSELNKMVVIAMSMVRNKEVFVCFCINSIFDLDRNLSLSRADLLLNVYGENLVSRGRFLAFFKAEDGRDRIKELYLKGKKYYDYSRPKANFFSTFPSYFVVDEKLYEEKKNEGVREFLSHSQSRIDNRDKLSRDKLILWIYKNNKITQEKLAEISDLSPKTIWNILQTKI